MGIKKGLFISSAIVSLAVVSPAWAQTAPAAAPAATTNSDQIAEVVVTAERRALNIQKSALSITAITGDQLQKTGAVQAVDLLTAIPGLSMSHQNSNSYIGLFGLQSGGGSMYTDASMTFNYGGIPLARQTAAQSSFYDLERVEVLKGPQGTLYGRNATLGAMNLLPNQPKDEYSASISVAAGNYAAVSTTGYVNLPLSDQVATRLAFQTTHHDGYYSNGYDDANNFSGRASLLYRPDDKLSVLVWFDGYHDRSKGPSSTFTYYLSPTQKWINASNPWQTISAPGTCAQVILCPTYAQNTVGGVNAQAQPPAAAGGALANGFADLSPTGLGNTPLVGNDGYSHIDQYIFASEVNYKMDFATATVNVAHVSTKMNFLNYTNGLVFYQNTLARQDSIEARLASNGSGRLKWVVGGFYYYEHQNAFFSSTQNTGFALLNTPNLKDTSYAAFADSTFSVTSKIRLTAGIRYTNEEKTQDGSDTTTGVTSAQIPTFLAAQATCYLATINSKVNYQGYLMPSNFCVIPNGGDVKENNISWKGGIEADLAERSMVYATVKTGFRAGGFTIGTGNIYKPEHMTAYEIGSKNEFFDRRVQANINAFYWDYKDEQLSQLQQYFVNGIAAGQTSYPFNVNGNLYGVEFTGQAIATSHDHFSADILWAKGKLEKTPLLTNSAGTTVALTNVPRWDLPEWTTTLGYIHSMNLANGAGLDLGVRVHTASRTILRLIDVPGQVPGDFQGAYAKWDADLTYTAPGGKWSLQGFVNNITNVAVIGTGSSGQVAAPTFFKPSTNPATVRSAALEAPRVFGVRIKASF